MSPADDRTRFGYEYNQEMERHARQVSAEMGVDPERFNAEVFFEASKRIDREHLGKPRFRERQEWYNFRDSMRAPKPRPSLTAEEIAYLIDRLHGINDPVGVRLRGKLERML